MFPIVNLNLFLILYASKLLKRIPFFSRDFFILIAEYLQLSKSNKRKFAETLLVSINDELVEMFLKNRISFDEISTKMNQIINSKLFRKYRLKKVNNLAQIEKLNEFVRLKTKSLSVISKIK